MVAAGQDMHRLRRLFVILDKQAPLAVEKFDPQMPTFQQPTFGSNTGNFTSTVPKKDIQIPDFLKNRK